MGTWGFNVLDDDTARDVYDDYMKHYNVGRGREEIMSRLREQWADTIEEEDERPLFWIAVAKAQWDCGELSAELQERVRQIVERGEGLARWEDEGPKVLAKRKEKLAKFLDAIGEANPKPRKPKKPVKRKPVFKVGDCLAVRLSDGDWGAVLVLAEEQDGDPAEEPYGSNTLGQLSYKAREKPGLDVFEKREWLRLSHHGWGNREGGGAAHVVTVDRTGFQKFKERFEVIGSVVVEGEAPQPVGLCTWEFAEQAVYQEKWDRGIRD
jgi:hypothetical protein